MVLLLVHLGGAVAWSIGLFYKFRGQSARNWSGARIALVVACLCGVAANVVAIPHIQLVLAAVTGVPNITQAMCAVVSLTGSAGLLAMGLLWRYDAAQAKRWVRWVVVVYAVDIIAATVFFAISDVPVERLHLSFMSYYVPRQFTIFLFYLCFFVPITVEMLILAFWCLTWAREGACANLPRLRRALLILGVGAAALGIGIGIQLVTVFAARFTTISLVATALAAIAMVTSLTIVLVAYPFVLANPMAASSWLRPLEQLSRWRTFCTLRPLHQALQHVNPDAVLVIRGRKYDAHHRVRRMVIELNDWHCALARLYDPHIAREAEARATASGLTGTRLRAAVEAAQLKAALEASRREDRPLGGDPSPDPDANLRDGQDIETEIAWWLQVARAYRNLPLPEPTRTTPRA